MQNWPKSARSKGKARTSVLLSQVPSCKRGTRLQSGAAMAGVIEKFLLASMLMWIIPVAVLYGFNHNVFPGSSDLSPHSLTLWSGLLAVISVNAVIGFYMYLAMKEPSVKHEPDPAFLAQARASIQKPIESTEGPSQPREKDE